MIKVISINTSIKHRAPQWVPIVFLSHQASMQSFVTSPFLLAGMVTILLSLKINKTILVVVLGMATFSLLKIVCKELDSMYRLLLTL